MTDNLATSRCPYCLQTKPSITSATLSSGVAWEDALDAEIDRQIEHTENLISNLYRERAKLLRKRNEIRSPIYSLPPEILTLIFKFTFPPLNFLQIYGLDDLDEAAGPHIISVLTAVSARWHNLVSSTPSLWTSFVADDRKVNIMKTILSRSGNLSVAASLHFPEESVSYEAHEAMLAPVLQEHASRIRMLYVYNAPLTWLKEHIPTFIHIELLCLEDDGSEQEDDGSEQEDDGSERKDPVSIDSTCTRLVLKDISYHISFSWSKIEVLHFCYTPLDLCLMMLEKCTHLVEYRVRDPIKPKHEGIRLPSSPFVLPRLTLFEWSVNYESPGDLAMLRYIRMPALRTLIWDEEYGVSPPGLLSTFLNRLHSTLSAVQIQDNWIHSDFSTYSNFLNLCHVEGLVFRKCAHAFIDDVFNRLGSETRLVGNQETPVLPKLRLIFISEFGIEIGHPDQAAVLKTFRRSCSQPSESFLGSPFRIEFADRQMNWEPEFKEELIRMVEKGYQVELWEDLKPVDWLPRTMKLPRLLGSKIL